jgi:hypothetical protein
MTKDQQLWTGGILRNLDGKPVVKLSAEVGDPGTAHAVAVSESGDVYVAQLSGVAQKFVKQ